MPQWLQVLGGCVAAYVAGVIVAGTVNVLVAGRGLDVFGAVAIFGLLAMIPFCIAALILWAVFARSETCVSAKQAIVICGAVFVVLSVAGGLIRIGLVSLVGPFVLGCAFGAAFWLGASGFRRDVQMSRAKSGNL